MASLRTGYRILILNYGYYGSIEKPYVIYEILEREEEINSCGDIIKTSLDRFPYQGQCPKGLLAPIDMLEHLIISLQSNIAQIELKCLHGELQSGKLKKIPDKTSILIPLVNRVFTAEIVDSTLEFIQEGSLIDFSDEFVLELKNRLPDDFVSKILSILEKYEIPIHDIEDDSRLIALGEGKNCLVIKKRLHNDHLVWLKYPFPILDLDEISNDQLNLDNMVNLIDNTISQLESHFMVKWPEFKRLINNSIVPKHLVSGTNGKTTTARMIAHIIREVHSKKLGITSTSGIYIDGEEPEYGDFTGPWSARQLLLNPIDEVVLETARGGLIREGVIFEKVETAILTNVAADHIGLRDISTVQQMGELKSLIFRAATKCVVINLDEPVIKNIYEQIKSGDIPLKHGCNVWGVTSQNNFDPSINHMIILDNKQIKLKQDNDVRILGNISQFTFSDYGIISFMNINAIGALAVTIGYGVDPDKAFQSICRFKADVLNAPGRGNFIHHADRHFMLDYGHNPHAMLQIKQTIDNIRQQYDINKVVFLALTAGDRREEDLREYGKILSTMDVDVVIFKDLWVDRRGKEEGEVGLLVADELLRCGFQGEIYQIPNPINAILEALNLSEERDLVYLCAEKADIMQKMIEEYNFIK